MVVTDRRSFGRFDIKFVSFSDTPFKQQQLKACRPILTAVNVMPLFLAAGIAFIPIGIGMLVASNNTKELVRNRICLILSKTILIRIATHHEVNLPRLILILKPTLNLLNSIQ